MTVMRTRQAVIQALSDELESDPTVFLMGEDIGSGGPFAQSAARALLHNTKLSAKDIVTKSLKIAGEICIYTNHNITIEELECNND